MDEAPSVPEPAPAPRRTVIEVVYPHDRGAIGLRGSHAPLSWDHTEAPGRSENGSHFFYLPLDENEIAEVKVVRGEEWAAGRNYAIHAGDHLRIQPSFDQTAPALEEGVEIPFEGGIEKLDVLLPPTYAEHSEQRYPVLYVLDGQSLWAHSQDPFGVWALDQTLRGLYELDAIDEVIIVGVHTADARLDKLSPLPDETYGGGGGPAFLERLVSTIKPTIDARYRTRTDRESTAILGSSMGGLFAFFAAWTRPDVFGKAACMSSSFWWGNRWAVRVAQTTTPPSPRPFIYMDTGAAPTTEQEEDAKQRDGYHHTRSMHRALTRAGFDMQNEVHRLVFPGHQHEASSWAARISLPLQILFPRVMILPTR